MQWEDSCKWAKTFLAKKWQMKKWRKSAAFSVFLLQSSSSQLPPSQLPVVGSEADRVTPTPPFFIPGTPQWDPLLLGGGFTHKHLVSPHLYTQHAHRLTTDSHYRYLLVLLFTLTHTQLLPPLGALQPLYCLVGGQMWIKLDLLKIPSVCFDLFAVRTCVWSTSWNAVQLTWNLVF